MASISVLYNDDASLAHGSPQDAIAVKAVVDCAKAIAYALVEQGHDVELEGLLPDTDRVLIPRYDDRGVDGEKIQGDSAQQHALEAAQFHECAEGARVEQDLGGKHQLIKGAVQEE